MSESTDTNVRKDYKDCSEQKLGDFIGSLQRHGAFVRKSYVPVNDSSHFERFNYACGKDKISIVYDTKAHRLSVTAKLEFVNALDDLYEGRPCSLSVVQPMQKLKISEKLRSRQNDQSTNSNPVRKKDDAAQKTENTEKAKKQKNSKKPFLKQSLANNTGTQGAQQGAEQASGQRPQQNGSSSANPVSGRANEHENGFSVKDISKERFEAIMKAVRALKGIQTKTKAEFTGKPEELITVEITDAQNQKVYFRYMPRKKSLSLQGKRSSVYADVQMLLTSGADFNSAISSHIKSVEVEDQKSAGLERKLKKLIPSAFEYLSEQSKIDLTIGLIDIYNNATRLSDYSVLLVPPYRGLERLIYDLQIAEGISVKMIGQGFEKRSDGSYCLKAGYRKKIDSVIYNEVLSALYTEYFTERHFLTHSDNSSDSSARVIRELSDARAKYDNLLAVIDYNCKKLKEIGFTTAREPENGAKKSGR